MSTKVTLVLGFQPGDFSTLDTNFLGSLKPDRLMYQCGRLGDVNYSKPFMDRIAKYANGIPFLVGCDSHDFNDWGNQAHWAAVQANSMSYAEYAKKVGASGIVLNTEQEDHQIPFGPGGRYTRMDPRYVWPGDPVRPKLNPNGSKTGMPPLPRVLTGADRCVSWVYAVDQGFSQIPIALWITSAVQVEAPPGFYPCMNIIAETAGGVEIWPYMWEPGYAWGADPNLPKKRLLPKKPKGGYDGRAWCEVVRQSFTARVHNEIAPTISFGVDTVQYYQGQIRAKQVKDFSGMVSVDYINRFKGLPYVNLVLWGNVFAIEPTMVDFVRNLMQQLRG